MFDFNNVEVQAGFEQKYMNPGVDIVKFSEITNGLSSQKQSPYVRITVVNNTGLSCTTDFYLNEGQAFNISANTFFKYIAYTNNLDMVTDEAKIKGMLSGVSTPEQVAAKLSSLLVGKSIGMVVKGEWVNPQDLSKRSWIKAIMSGLVSKSTDVSKLTYDASKHIKGQMDVRETNGNASAVKTATSW